MAKWREPIPCQACKGRGYHYVPTSRGYIRQRCHRCKGTGVTPALSSKAVGVLLVILGTLALFSFLSGHLNLGGALVAAGLLIMVLDS